LGLDANRARSYKILLGFKGRAEARPFLPSGIGPEDEQSPLPEPLKNAEPVGVFYDGLDPVVEAFHPAGTCNFLGSRFLRFGIF
jgi:hypothetical protein